MESNEQDGFVVTSTTGNTAQRNNAFRAFDGVWDEDSLNVFRTDALGYLEIVFPLSVKVGKYKIYLGYYHSNYTNMKKWSFEGLVDGAWITLHSYEKESNSTETLTFDFEPVEVEGVRIKCLEKFGSNTWGIDELEVFEYRTVERVLILNENSYKKWDETWQTVTSSTPTEQQYLDDGMADLSIIPESAWKELQGEASLFYYTDDPFAEGITVETDTEPFSIYDEFGDSMEVLYYTDNPDKEDAELEIIANYSPLDELEGDFEVVTWSDTFDDELDENSEEIGKVLSLNALPNPQFIRQVDANDIYGELSEFISDEVHEGEGRGTVRYLVSSNKSSWRTWDGEKFVNVSTSNMKNIVDNGMSAEVLESLTESDWSTWESDKLYLGIYLEEDIRDKTKAQIDSISYRDMTPLETTKIADAKLYILNTVSTINVTYVGNTLSGTIDDEDEGKVQYRILLNGDNYFPSDGSFTPLMPSPLDIATTIPSDRILIDENNILKVEFKDYWGSVDYWEANFIGTYSGLMFSDSSGKYYSTDMGEVLQYLDFGVIMAGQTTSTQSVLLKNTYGYSVNNIKIRANQDELPEGMRAQFGLSQISFESLSELNIPETLEDDEEIVFYVRLSTQLGITPQAHGELDIIVTADKVE